MNKHLHSLVITGLLVGTALLFSGLTQADSTPSLAATMHEAVAHPEALPGHPAIESEALTKFYDQNGWQPLWVTSSGLTPRGEQALAAIAQAEEHGLTPASYSLAGI